MVEDETVLMSSPELKSNIIKCGNASFKAIPLMTFLKIDILKQFPV